MKKTNGFLLGLVVSLTFSAVVFAQSGSQYKNIVEKPKVLVFPNPVENVATFTVDPLGYPFLRCDIFNLIGNKVFSIPAKEFKAAQTSDSLSYQFNFSELHTRQR